MLAWQLKALLFVCVCVCVCGGGGGGGHSQVVRELAW